VARAFPRGGLPNLLLPGVVDTVAPWLAAADLALNPMISGSGSNLKLFEYLAAGLPVVSTSFGVRGVDGADSSALIATSLERFPEAVRGLLADPDLAGRRESARQLALRHDWDTIAEGMADTIRRVAMLQGGPFRGE
jgi:glycosyltransferase involved in cell wall biosynthesis